jgi:hypothetical protein
MAKNRSNDREPGEELTEYKVDEIKKSKADVIRESALTPAQKDKYLRDIGEIKDEFDPSKVSFEVYATVRKVPRGRHHAMKVFPPAKAVSAASLTEWDQIFKNF